tara:strand:+ start:1084 stop:1344 length:261 start_codon:yes stop_codon:yes gene_type:complete
MEETFKYIDKFGFTLVAAVAMAVALYKIVMFALVGKASQFEESHHELHDMQVKTLERLTEIEKDFARLEGKIAIIEDFVKKQMIGE